MKIFTGDNGAHWYGFSLSLLTAVLWGVLPVFLSLCLEVMDAMTITLYRFWVAGLFVFIWLYQRKALPQVKILGKNKVLCLLVASILLVCNYVANVQGLVYLNPETAQVVMQTAPFMLMLGGVIFFNERLGRIEVLGVLALFIGLGLFFNDRLALLLLSMSQFTTGVLVILFAATTWAAYALMQKPLLRVLTAKQLTLLIYIIGFCALLPFSSLSQLWAMQGIHLFALGFCCLNTIVAYGAFTEALHVWQAAKVSAVLALAPVFTFLSMMVAVRVLPEHFTASVLDTWAYLGALIVVLGSAFTALGRAKTAQVIIK
ncbi:DMT family transporter [Paraglaciecola aestuariivivens]